MLRLRKANERDVSYLEKLFRSLYRPQARWSADRIKQKMQEGREYYLMQNAKSSGAVEIVFEGKECELVAIAVHPQNEGLGSQLLRLLEDLAVTEGCKKIWCNTLDINRVGGFYEKNGWKQESYTPNFLDSHGCFKFSKSLRSPTSLQLSK